MTSATISKVSAALLLLGGLVLLFAPDVVLPLLVQDLPQSAAWLGELIGAGWLSLAALNWLSRGSVLGGIYGRPVVIVNAALYFITSMVLIRVAAANDGPYPLWLAAAPTLILAAVYGWLLMRGPLGRDIQSSSRAPGLES